MLQKVGAQFAIEYKTILIDNKVSVTKPKNNIKQTFNTGFVRDCKSYPSEKACFFANVYYIIIVYLFECSYVI